MPRTKTLLAKGGKTVDYYEIAARQFQQQVLPGGLPKTTVWGYGARSAPGTVAQGGSFSYPAFTIEAKAGTPVRVQWSNELVDAQKNYLPPLLPVDQTLHWANPPGGVRWRDQHGMDQASYAGPVPMSVHLHGAHTYDWSDGYPEAWFLPAALNIPSTFAKVGSFYDTFKTASPLGASWQPGSAVFEYPNDMLATTLWYHDHTLGMTRENVYAGLAGFFLVRGGPGDLALGVLPGPAPAAGDSSSVAYHEIPILIQDRSFNADGSLFYPANRAFFEGKTAAQLQVPFAPSSTLAGETSDVPPLWNPEYFGNAMVVNGQTWPFLNVEKRRYRFRLLNGCGSRFLILRTDNGLPFWQIGADGGFLPAPVQRADLLMAPAERADVIVDFSNVPVGTTITVLNVGPDEPFGGGEPGVDFASADPQTTGRVMQFRVVPSAGLDLSTPPALLALPPVPSAGPESVVRRISLNENASATVFAKEDASGNIVEVLASDPDAAPIDPTAGLLGTLDGDSNPVAQMWADAITENPSKGATEVWEIYNFTADAHPIHVHLVEFEVVDRQSLVTDAEGMSMAPAQLIPGTNRPPEPWETGLKDTVIAYPGEVTRLRAKFDMAGLYVWHCHILEHEDNEMMRPYCVGNATACQQAGMGMSMPRTMASSLAEAPLSCQGGE